MAFSAGGLIKGQKEQTDAELIELVRAGDSEAFGVLYERHVAMARGRARSLTRSAADSEEAVAEAFARILAALRRGHGPQDNFAAYLSTSVHHACLVRGQRSRTDVVDPLELARSNELPDSEDFTGRVESGMVLAKAFSNMPSRWQAVLWLTEVEDLPAQEVSERFDLSRGALAALSYRARNALTEAYLGAHLAEPSKPQCQETVRNLPAHLRGSLSTRRARRLETHLKHCGSCSSAEASLRRVNEGLRG